MKGQHTEAEINVLRDNVAKLNATKPLSLIGQQLLQQYLQIISEYDRRNKK